MSDTPAEELAEHIRQAEELLQRSHDRGVRECSRYLCELAVRQMDATRAANADEKLAKAFGDLLIQIAGMWDADLERASASPSDERETPEPPIVKGKRENRER